MTGGSVHLVVQQARTWIGTPYGHQGRIKKTLDNTGCCDCLGLVVGDCKELDIRAMNEPHKQVIDWDLTNYHQQVGDDSLQKALDGLFPRIEILEPGTIGLFIIGNRLQHIGIISDYSINPNQPSEEHGLIHCHSGVGKVVEHRLDKAWRRRMIASYRLL